MENLDLALPIVTEMTREIREAQEKLENETNPDERAKLNERIFLCREAIHLVSADLANPAMRGFFQPKSQQK